MAKAKNDSPLLRMAIDIGPLVVFFAVYLLVPSTIDIEKLLTATVAFMLAMGAALALSWWKTGHISPMLWISAVLVRRNTSSSSSSMRSANRLTWNFSRTTLVTRPVEVAWR